jgi:SAM-dependent methyltransferase
VSEKPKEQWGVSDRYERYVGRWSRLVARDFLEWSAVGNGKRWADVGCGTGALVATILADYAPSQIVAIDRAAGFLTEARRVIADTRVQFRLGDALDLPLGTASCDVAVSGLVLNFVADPAVMLREMIRVTNPGGKVAAYVWDYAGRMEMMRYFWDAAIAVTPHDAKLDQAERFPLCQPEPLQALFQEAGLAAVSVRSIDIPTIFQDFDDYWDPFLGQQGAAPTYLAAVDEETRQQIRRILHARLVPQADGRIALTARAWAVQGIIAEEQPA